MTDPRIEAAARALCADRGICPDDNEEFGRHFGKDHNWQAYIYMVSIILAAADAAAWRLMTSAPRDRTDILARTRPDVFLEDHNLSGWNNRSVVIRHEGIVNDDFDMGWPVAAPVGYGGMPDKWFVGWQPVPASPANSAELGGVDG